MTDFIPARDELEELAEAYRQADVAEKQAKTEKDQLRPAILALISEIVREEVPLARKTVQISVEDLNDLYGGDPEVWRQKEWPTWNIVGIEPDFDIMTVTFEENDAFVKFEFGVNGYKFGRTVASSQPSIDLKGMSLEPMFRELEESGAIVQTIHYELDEKKASKFMASNPNSKRVFEKYTVKGKPQIRLLPFTPQQEED